MSEQHPPFVTSSTSCALLPHLVRVELVREGAWPVGDPITSPEGVFSLLKPHAERWDREHFLSILLDGGHRVVGIDNVTVGILNSALVHPREVFKSAILASAAAIVVAHNHPSGDLTPSNEDRAITKRLVEAGTLLGIRVLDHLIVATGGYYSFQEAGTLPNGDYGTSSGTFQR